MWYAVETAFVDGRLLGSECVFQKGDESPVGRCYYDERAEPVNSCEKKFGDRIEIHVDWFESEELAEKFREGLITYRHIYDAYYDNAVKSTRRRFRRREIVDVDPSKGIYPHKGVF